MYVKALRGDEVLQHIHHQVLQISAFMLPWGLEPHSITANLTTEFPTLLIRSLMYISCSSGGAVWVISIVHYPIFAMYWRLFLVSASKGSEDACRGRFAIVAKVRMGAICTF